MTTLNLAELGLSSQSEGSNETDANRISFGSSKSNNPQLEKFRKNLKSQLFTREDSNSSNSTQNQSNQCSDNTPTNTASSIPFCNKQKNSESVSPHHSRFDKIRNSVKGNLLLLSHKSASISPANHTHQRANTFRDVGELKPFSLSVMNCVLDESSKNGEDSSPLPTPDMIHEIEELTGDILEELDDKKDSPQSLKFLPVQRQNIFFNNDESEIQDIKDQFGIDEKSNIIFFKGDFSTYYQEDDILGEGTSGVVKKCFKVGTNEPFAVKIVQYKGDSEILSLIVKEFLNCKKLDHKNVIKVYELYVDYFKKKIYSVMELAECCEMFDVIKDLGHYSEAVASGIFKQILTGISYLHMHGVCHRDLKPNNILVSKDGKIVKITDFNVSKFLDKTEEKQKFSSLSSENYKMWTSTGTIAFTAPEVFLENEYTERVDIWSAGVVLYIMLCGYQPFQADYVQDLIELIKEGKYEFHKDQWEHISEQAKDLVKHCLDTHPKTRYTPFDALMHPWIANHGKISDIKICHVKENFRVYYKKCTSNKKNVACAFQIKKIQVTSPSLHVSSPYARRLRQRSGTMRLFDDYLNKNRLSPKLSAKEKENKVAELNGRTRFTELSSSLAEESAKDITRNEKPAAEVAQPASIELGDGFESPTRNEENDEFTGRGTQVKKLSFKEKMEDESAKIGSLCIRESSEEESYTPKHSQVSWAQYCN